MINPVNFLSSEFVESVGKVIDNLVTSDEERGELKLKFLNQQLETIRETNKMQLAQIQADTELMKAKRDIILAEANSDSWLAKNWRPITMIMFAFTAVAHAFGLDDLIARSLGTDGIDPDYISHFFTLLTIGIGGHVVGRSGEKMMKSWKKNSNRTLKSRKGEPQEPINK